MTRSLASAVVIHVCYRLHRQVRPDRQAQVVSCQFLKAGYATVCGGNNPLFHFLLRGNNSGNPEHYSIKSISKLIERESFC